MHFKDELPDKFVVPPWIFECCVEELSPKQKSDQKVRYDKVTIHGCQDKASSDLLYLDGYCHIEFFAIQAIQEA